jgi:HSP90 family molecular chaperone
VIESHSALDSPSELTVRQMQELGAYEVATNRNKVSELMCYLTSKSGVGLISFKEDVDRTKEGAE